MGQGLSPGDAEIVRDLVERAWPGAQRRYRAQQGDPPLDHWARWPEMPPGEQMQWRIYRWGRNLLAGREATDDGFRLTPVSLLRVLGISRSAAYRLVRKHGAAGAVDEVVRRAKRRVAIAAEMEDGATEKTAARRVDRRARAQ